MARDEVRSLLLCDRLGRTEQTTWGLVQTEASADTGADRVGSGECFVAREGELDSPEWKPRMILISL